MLRRKLKARLRKRPSQSMNLRFWRLHRPRPSWQRSWTPFASRRASRPAPRYAPHPCQPWLRSLCAAFMVASCRTSLARSCLQAHVCIGTTPQSRNCLHNGGHAQLCSPTTDIPTHLCSLRAAESRQAFSKEPDPSCLPRALWPPRADPGRVHRQERHHRAGSLVLHPRGGPGAHPWCRGH